MKSYSLSHWFPQIKVLVIILLLLLSLVAPASAQDPKEKNLSGPTLTGEEIYWGIDTPEGVSVKSAKVNIRYSTAIKLSEHFLANEFRCKHCQELRIDMMLIIKLEELRKAIGNKPIVITSGYRCPTHNLRVGGVSKSQHLQGKAADIYVNGVNNRYLAKKAKEVGFTFVKVYSGWIHVDVR